MPLLACFFNSFIEPSHQDQPGTPGSENRSSKIVGIWYGKLFLAFACASLMTVSAVRAQNVYADIATGMAKQGMAEAEKLLEDAPALLDETLKRGETGEEFETAQFCRGALQSAVNLGAALSNIMPFSRVWTLEDERGPVGRFRIMLNGEQIRADVYCEGNLLRSVQLPWGPGSAEPEAVQVTAFSALAGAALNLKLQGAFDRLESETVAAPNFDGLEMGDAAPDAKDTSHGADAPLIRLSASEKEALALAIASCWNVGVLSTEALGVSIRVSVDMARNGVPDAESITLVSHSGTSEAAAALMFESARRAIIRCGVDGYLLPSEKYDAWQAITFEVNAAGFRPL